MGYEVWAASEGEENNKKELIASGITCIDIPFNRSPLSKDNIKAYQKIRTLFTTEEFELVHVHTPIASVISRIAFRHSKKGKILYTVHGFHFYKGASLLNWLLYYPLERLVSRWTDKIITINEEDFERALTMGFANSSVHFVHGVGVIPPKCLFIDDRELLKQRLGLTKDSVVISYIAEINKNKNHGFLLHNWKRIKSKAPNAALLIIGTGNMSLEIKRVISELQLEDVFLLGYRKDIYQLLEITDIVSLLSFREGLPKSIMEAMTSKIPCVVSDTRGLRDLIIDGQSGYIVTQGNNDLLVKAFLKLLNNRERRIEMGTKAFQNVRPYLLDNVLLEYSEIYQDILRKG